MPIEYLCVQCYECKTFQVQQAKKKPQFVCAICHSKQSIRKVCAVSNKAADIRNVVQALNMQRCHLEAQPPAQPSQPQAHPENTSAPCASSHTNDDIWSEFLEPQNPRDASSDDERPAEWGATAAAQWPLTTTSRKPARRPAKQRRISQPDDDGEGHTLGRHAHSYRNNCNRVSTVRSTSVVAMPFVGTRAAGPPPQAGPWDAGPTVSGAAKQQTVKQQAQKQPATDEWSMFLQPKKHDASSSDEEGSGERLVGPVTNPWLAAS